MRLFTVEEANEHLVAIVPLAEALKQSHDRIQQLRPRIAGVLEKGDSGSAAASRMVLLFDRFERSLTELQKLGVEVKDPASGLLDFPARYQGRTILLCWRLGEPHVEWWHDLHTGFAGRRPVTDLVE